MQVSLERLQDIVINSDGKLFSASFIKKDGSIRDIVCRLGVRSYIKGTGKPSYALKKDNPYQLVFDFNKKGYRVINMETLFKIKSELFEVPLTEESIPDIANPFDNLPEPTLGPVSELPPLVTGANPTVVAMNNKLVPQNFNNLTQAQKYELLFRD